MSSERRKKPKRVGSGWASAEIKETEEREIDTDPCGVNPNFSKRIIGRLSEEMVRVLISAAVRVRTQKMENRREEEVKEAMARFGGRGI